MIESTAAERAYARWYAEKNPGVLRTALQGAARIVRNMDPRLRELLQEELAKEADTRADGEWISLTDAASRLRLPKIGQKRKRQDVPFVRRLVEKGKLQDNGKTGKARKVSVASVEAYLASTTPP